MRVYSLYNNHHIGDAIMILRFLYAHKEFIKRNDIIIHYYYSDYCKEYLRNIEDYTEKGIIELFTMNKTPSDAIEFWMGYPIDNVHVKQWSLYHQKFYRRIASFLGFNHELIHCDLWQNEPYLNNIYDSLSDKYKNIDILIINSTPQGKAYTKNSTKMDNMCRFLKQKYTIVTTKKVDDITCTLDDNLTIRDIGAISTHSKYIISIMTGPSCGLYNTMTKAYVKKWFFLHHLSIVFCNIDNTVITNQKLAPIYTYFTDIATS